MKKLFIIFLFTFGCASEADLERLQFKLDQKQDQIDFLDSALVSATKRIGELEQEQTFQFKDQQFLFGKVRQHDSLILQRQFKRDIWGKAGEFTGRLLGLR